MTTLGTATVIRGDALHLPLPDNSVDLVVTSPPYFGLRSYQDGCPDCDNTGKAKRPDSHGMKVCPDCGNVANRKRCNKCDASMKWPSRAETFSDDTCPTCNGTGTGHYDGQLGSEPTPAAFVDALLAATREMVRVVKPSGSIWVNLGDKYAGSGGNVETRDDEHGRRTGYTGAKRGTYGMTTKSLMGIPWRYALACIDDLGLILRAEIIWSKPNGLPESVTDRVRRSHEQWFHFTLEPRYFSAVDEIRETFGERHGGGQSLQHGRAWLAQGIQFTGGLDTNPRHPLGKLPGSVWNIPTEPLTVPDHLGVDHFAAFPTEWPRRIIAGWSPCGVCVGCGEGRRPVGEVVGREGGAIQSRRRKSPDAMGVTATGFYATGHQSWNHTIREISGYACACPTPTAATTPSVILDPFGGTGTTALVAKALGRHGISIDMSNDYCRLARWRTTDRNQLAKAARVVRSDAARAADGLDMEFLFDMEADA